MSLCYTEKDKTKAIEKRKFNLTHRTDIDGYDVDKTIIN